jgi:hypothetical protein
MAGGTAFQPNAFQPNGFQIAGGVNATSCDINIAFTQDGDTVSLTCRLPFGAGSKKKPHKYIARFKGQDYEFSDIESMEEFVEWAIEAEKPKPKKLRKPVKIRLTPDYEHEVSQFTEIPATIYQLPASRALEQVRRLEARINEEEDDAEWLILIA